MKNYKKQRPTFANYQPPYMQTTSYPAVKQLQKDFLNEFSNRAWRELDQKLIEQKVEGNPICNALTVGGFYATLIDKPLANRSQFAAIWLQREYRLISGTQMNHLLHENVLTRYIDNLNTKSAERLYYERINQLFKA